MIVVGNAHKAAATDRAGAHAFVNKIEPPITVNGEQTASRREAHAAIEAARKAKRREAINRITALAEEAPGGYR